MTKLLQRLHDELVRRHYVTTTRESYLKIDLSRGCTVTDIVNTVAITATQAQIGAEA